MIGNQLTALTRQGCKSDWEVIVVDNRSTDGTRSVAERSRGLLPRLVVVDAPDKYSAAYARDVGVRAASGENVALCDAEVDDGWLAAAEDALREHRAVAFRTATQRLNPAASARSGRQTEGRQEYTYPPYLPYSGATIAVRREPYRQLGGFDETMLACEDADFCRRLQHAGVALHFVRDAVVHVRLRPTTRAMCRQARPWGECNVALYKKCRPSGMPALNRLHGLRNLTGMVLRLPQLASRTLRARLLWDVSWAAGRTLGPIKLGIWGL